MDCTSLTPIINSFRPPLHGTTAPSGPEPPHYRRFAITLGRAPLDRRSARRRNLHLTSHNNHKRQTSMPPAAFEPKIQASELPPTYALGRGYFGARTGTTQQTNICLCGYFYTDMSVQTSTYKSSRSAYCK